MDEQIAEGVRDRWETSDNPIVHKIQEYGAHNHFFVRITMLHYKPKRKYMIPD